MKTRILNLVFAICFLIPLFFNVPQANAAPLNDPPTPSPLYEGTIKGNPCAGTMTSAGVLIGANAPVFVCPAQKEMEAVHHNVTHQKDFFR